MAFNPIETSLYVTLKNLTQEQSVLARIRDNPDLSTPRLNDAYQQSDTFLQQEIIAFTAPPSELNPYQQIIYKFSKRLERQFMTGNDKATDMTLDALSMNNASKTMIGLRKEQMRFMVYVDQFLDYCQNRPVSDALYKTYEWKRKNALVKQIFDDSKPSITSQEFSDIIDMAHEADRIKNSFTRVNSIYLPK